jgi:hypothetical protein
MVICHGWEEMGRYLREFFAQWRHYRIEVETLTPLDDSTVLMEGYQYGIGKRSGAEAVESLNVVFKFDQVQVVAMYWHPERSEALEPLGCGTDEVSRDVPLARGSPDPLRPGALPHTASRVQLPTCCRSRDPDIRGRDRRRKNRPVS